MAQLDIISAGAAQSVVAQVARDLSAGGGHEVRAGFGAVGAQKAKLLGGAPADLVVLTRAMIEELLAAGQLAAGTARDLGSVGLGIAVPAGAPWPDMTSVEKFRANVAAARGIFLPDPEMATAGIHLVKVLERLGVRQQLAGRLRAYANGNAAMTALASAAQPLLLGITMVTEIKLVAGVELVAPLPAELQLATRYAGAVAARSTNPGFAAEFLHRLTGPAARPMLAAAGFEL